MQNHAVTVLIVENHPMMRAALSSSIADEPNLTICGIAGHGLDTLPIIESLCPEVILFALESLGENNLDTLKVLRNKSFESKILVLVNSEIPGQEEAALQCGADAVLPRSVERIELLTTLRHLEINPRPRQEKSIEENKITKGANGKITTNPI